jgi:glycosyltransferase involved in cell wall biosynthesis
MQAKGGLMNYSHFPMRHRLSIVIPAYNEEENLPILMQEIDTALQKMKQSAEILLINDGSNDNTMQVMLELQRIYSNYDVRVLSLDTNHGQSAALDAGFKAATGNIIISLDSDLQNDPADIPKLLSHMPEYDVVIGVRKRRQDTWMKRMSSRFANSLRDRVLQEKWKDTGCTLKVYKRSVLLSIKLFRGMHRFLPTLLKMEGARVLEVEVNHRMRIHGLSNYGFWNRLLGPFMDLLAVRWMKSQHLSYQVEEQQTRQVMTGQPAVARTRLEAL